VHVPRPAAPVSLSTARKNCNEWAESAVAVRIEKWEVPVAFCSCSGLLNMVQTRGAEICRTSSLGRPQSRSLNAGLKRLGKVAIKTQTNSADGKVEVREKSGERELG